MKLVALYLSSFMLASILSHGQKLPAIPDLDSLNLSIDQFFNAQAEIQISEINQTQRHRFLKYLPSPGYSPFTGGFTVQYNIAEPLQEIRLNHATKLKRAYIISTNQIAARELKNAVWLDHQSIITKIEEYTAQTIQDSLTTVLFQLSQRKYSKNEVTPTEFLTLSKGYEAYLLTRKKELNAIKQAIYSILIKAKIDVATNNVHFELLKHF